MAARRASVESLIDPWAARRPPALSCGCERSAAGNGRGRHPLALVFLFPFASLASEVGSGAWDQINGPTGGATMPNVNERLTGYEGNGTNRRGVGSQDRPVVEHRSGGIQQFAPRALFFDVERRAYPPYGAT